MKTADQVAAIIEQVKQDMVQDRISASAAAWKVAMACVGWAYVFAAYGEYCDPSNRRSRYRSDHETIKTKCQNFNGQDNVPGKCVGCKWFLGTAESDQKVHAGRTRIFDCRGFVYWVLHYVLGMWDRCPAGATTMWNTDSNWKAKGKVSEGVPEDVLVCLFVQDKDNTKKMSHIGFGYQGETLECSSGVQHFTSRNKKWTHYAIPACIDEIPDPDMKPTLRKGDSGTYVTLLQTMLIQRGYSCGSYGADGKFGNATLAAVKAFQADAGLTADGVVGRKTWDALEGSEPVRKYTVTVPGLTIGQAKALVSQYAGATMTEEK